MKCSFYLSYSLKSCIQTTNSKGGEKKEKEKRMHSKLLENDKHEDFDEKKIPPAYKILKQF